MDTPFICNINALGESQKTRYQEIVRNLKNFRQSIKELNDGYAFRYKAESESILEIAEFITYERLCCPFFDFELAVDVQTNWLWLRLRGQNGIKDFIRQEFDVQ